MMHVRPCCLQRTGGEGERPRTYSQQIPERVRWIEKGVGRGIDTVGSGYSQILRARRTMTAVSVSPSRRRLRLTSVVGAGSAAV